MRLYFKVKFKYIFIRRLFLQNHGRKWALGHPPPLEVLGLKLGVGGYMGAAGDIQIFAGLFFIISSRIISFVIHAH